jgi:hypothetical protein
MYKHVAACDEPEQFPLCIHLQRTQHTQVMSHDASTHALHVRTTGTRPMCFWWNSASSSGLVVIGPATMAGDRMNAAAGELASNPCDCNGPLLGTQTSWGSGQANLGEPNFGPRENANHDTRWWAGKHGQPRKTVLPQQRLYLGHWRVNITCHNAGGGRHDLCGRWRRGDLQCQRLQGVVQHSASDRLVPRHRVRCRVGVSATTIAAVVIVGAAQCFAEIDAHWQRCVGAANQTRFGSTLRLRHDHGYENSCYARYAQH